MNILTRTLLLATGALLAAGCATGRKQAEDSRLARHPVREPRLATEALDGYTRSGVFRIRGARNTFYLAGTCHIVADDQIPFPSPFYAAYQKAREIYVEMDITHMSVLANLGLTARM